MNYTNLLHEQGYVNGNEVNRCWKCDCTNFEAIGDHEEYDLTCTNCETLLSTVIEGIPYLNIEYGELNF